jgi:hypothetical protein
MTFPRNKWFDVKLFSDGLNVYFLKWSYRVRPHFAWAGFGLGFESHFFYGMPEAVIFIGFLRAYVEPLETYAEWPWNRKGKS